ncbi:MAG: cyclic nucleotide-binding domain-containing protein [Melioribacteraceae bacterium]|nr:cyclic nucleotide-binding domain-containing protein [Melioribacteraceae bacterium]
MEEEIKTKALWKDYSRELTSNKDKSLVEILKKIPLLSTLGKRELKTISKFAYERTFETNEFVFQTGQPGAAMFIIKEGEVKIVKENSDEEYIEITKLSAGDIFGELALLDSSPRSAGALVSKPTKAIAIFREDLNKLLETHPDIGGKIMMHLAVITGKRLKETTNQLIQMENEMNLLRKKLDEK